MKVLVDTSVWIDHLHRADVRLRRLLTIGIAYVATPVLGELAVGNLPNRRRTLADLRLMPRLTEPRGDVVLEWIETHNLGGKGLSWIDCVLLAAAAENGASIYTRDRVLSREAARLKLAFAE